MKPFLITYSRTNGSEEQWRSHIRRFIEALETDPDLRGRIAYRCMKRRGGDDYYHLATAIDDAAISTLQSRDWFKRYTEQSREVSGGKVEVVPLEIVAETGARLADA
jgi:hypothetical protein